MYSPTSLPSTSNIAMPFPFTLPTTSSVRLSDCFTSPTHPALPLTAANKRLILRNALKRHKRLEPSARSAHLHSVHEALVGYLPYLGALNTASAYRDIGSELVQLDFQRPLTVEWRTTLSATLPGKEAPRPKLTGLHHEIAFTLSTLAYVQTLRARAQLALLHGTQAVSPDQRTNAIATAMNRLLDAHSIHSHLLSLPTVSTATTHGPPDTHPSTVSALASLALAEATLVVVAKDDPYAAAVADARNAAHTDWMFRAPSLPKVRAHLFARICLAAADHAATARGLLVAAHLDDALPRYAADLHRTARAKAARFLAVDAELAGQTGTALAWVRGAQHELGVSAAAPARKGLRGLKHRLQEAREDRLTSRGDGEDWGLDAGRLEEARVLESLETKWERENCTVNVQVVPPFEPLLAAMPSGREYHVARAWSVPVLDSAALVRMRVGGASGDEGMVREEEDDSGHDDQYGRAAGEPVGAFPGTGRDYGASGYY